MAIKKSKKFILEWALDRLNDVAVFAYSLLTGETWLKLATVGISIPDGAMLVGGSLLMIAVWVIIGYLKGQLED